MGGFGGWAGLEVGSWRLGVEFGRGWEVAPFLSGGGVETTCVCVCFSRGARVGWFKGPGSQEPHSNQ